jgi:hypothetical protein
MCPQVELMATGRHVKILYEIVSLRAKKTDAPRET